MYIIGITGGSGSGKTVALRVLEQMGALRLDCDEIYHELLAENEIMKAEIAAGFNGVLKDGAIDRKRLGEIVFSDKSALLKLNAITHKYVIDEINRRLAQWEKHGGALAAIDAIALIESGTDRLCDITIGIIALVETRIARIINRDNIAQEQVVARIDAQQPDSFYADNCDYILENNYSSVEDFKEKCKANFTKLIEGENHSNAR